MPQDLAVYAKKKKIQFFLFSFTDLFGQQRGKLVPASAIGEIQKSGGGFAGYATWLDMEASDPDLMALPDSDRVVQLPWKPEVAWVPCDLWAGDEPVAQSPRGILKRLMAEAEADNQVMLTGVEPEFYLIDPEGATISDPRDTEAKPCFDQAALMRRYDVVAEISRHMDALGWGVYQIDHEDAHGQFEINWDYADALTTADRHALFKIMVKEVAAAHGLRATFMPKPFLHLAGNGCHAHISLWTKTRKKALFSDKSDEMGLSDAGYHFIGGLIKHGAALSALMLPTVNSYKRVNASTTASGASWAPNAISYGGNNRSHMVRIPAPGRLEYRLADGAVNPYLLQAGILAAGRLGMEHRANPGTRCDFDAYKQPEKLKRHGKLPLNMLDALRVFEADERFCAAMGEDFSKGYVKLRQADWARFAAHLTDWEQQTTLDC
ncbi:MAG: type III glutamate--ammonia ligase [Silicimonas sp.]|nr:type III glutamate--ammonia ligase [Silicimonas sp.]